MKHFKLINLIILQLFAVLFLASCEKDHSAAYMVTLYCGEDLLEFVTPVITISNGDKINTVELTKSDFNQTKNNCVEWSKAISYDYWNFSNTISVTYKLKENLGLSEGTYNFFNQLFIAYASTGGSKIVIGSVNQSNQIYISNDIHPSIDNITIQGDSPEELLEVLKKIIPKDQSVDIYVDNKGNIIVS